MSRNLLYVLGGLALVGSALISLAGGVLHPVIGGHAHSAAALTAPLTPAAQLLIYTGALLLMAGLPVALMWLAPNLNPVGVVGFVLYFLGNSLSAQSHLVVEGFVAPEIARRSPGLIPPDDAILDIAAFRLLQTVGGLVLLAGLLLMGIGLLTVRGGVLPRWTGVPAVTGALLLLVPVIPQAPVLTGLVVELPRGLTVAVVGIAMIRAHRAASADRPLPVGV